MSFRPSVGFLKKVVSDESGFDESVSDESVSDESGFLMKVVF